MAGVFSGILPISAVVFSYVILRERFLWLHLGGVLCILLAIGLITIVHMKQKVNMLYFIIPITVVIGIKRFPHSSKPLQGE